MLAGKANTFGFDGSASVAVRGQNAVLLAQALPATTFSWPAAICRPTPSPREWYCSERMFFLLIRIRVRR